MNDAIRLNISQCAAARAHIYGAESLIYQKESERLFTANADPKLIGHAVTTNMAAKARFWREQAAITRLSGYCWQAAEELGGVA